MTKHPFASVAADHGHGGHLQRWLPPKPVWKSVKALTYVGACRYTGYVPKTAELTLECGHQLYRKASAPVPLKARCKECERSRQTVPRALTAG